MELNKGHPVRWPQFSVQRDKKQCLKVINESMSYTLNDFSLSTQKMEENYQNPPERLLGIRKSHEDLTMFEDYVSVLLTWY